MRIVSVSIVACSILVSIARADLTNYFKSEIDSFNSAFMSDMQSFLPVITWDEETNNGAIMYAKDTLYGDKAKMEYLSLIMVKGISEPRPAFISVKTAKDISTNVLLTFIRAKRGSFEIREQIEIGLSDEKDDYAYRFKKCMFSKNGIEVDVCDLFIKCNFLFFTVSKNGQQISRLLPLNYIGLLLFKSQSGK